MSNSDIKVVVSQKGTIPVYTTTRIGDVSAKWGGISGNITDQTDLINYIKSKTDTFVFEFDASQSSWTIQHNLGKKPAVTVVDSAGNVLTEECRYLDDNTVELLFNAPFKGTAYLN